MAFWAELRRRNVVRVAAAYLVVAWIVLQVVNVAGPALNLPEWFDSAVFVLLAIGFAIAVVMAWVFELTAAGLKRTEPLTEGAAPTPVAPGSGRLDIVLVGAVVLLVGLSVFQVVRPKTAAVSETASAEAVRLGPVVEFDPLSIAVLPFVNMSSDPEQEYFSDGLSEELLNVLAQIDALRVAGRTSSFAFKDRNEDLRAIGEQLSVANILEGSVRRSGDRLRITAQLVSVADGYHLWSQTYDRELTDVFEVQEEIAVAVADALSVTLGVAEAPVAPGRTDDVEIFDDYLRARALFFRNGAGDIERSVEIFRDILARDPDYALARVGLARADVRMIVFIPARSDEARREIEAVAAEARTRAPDDWTTHFLNATLYQIRRDWIEAGRSFERAAALAPASSTEVIESWAWMLIHVGRAEDSKAMIETALATDPLSTDATVTLQLALSVLGRNAEAEAEYQRSHDLGIANTTVEYVALTRVLDAGDEALAQARFQELITPAFSPLAWARGLSGVDEDPATALALIRAASEDPANASPTRLQTMSMFAVHYGDVDLALALSRRALVDMDGGIANGLWYPGTAAMRRDPAFKDLVRDLGLVDYWRETGEWGDFCRPLSASGGDDDFECF